MLHTKKGKQENRYESIRNISILVFPLVWMFHSSGLNNKTNSIYDRALSITYGDKSSFQDLLKKDTVSINHKNIKALATDMFKV